MQQAASGEDADRRRAADDYVSFYLGKGLRNLREEQELFLSALAPPVAATSRSSSRR